MVTVSGAQGDQSNDATIVQENTAIKVTMAGPQGYTLEGQGTVKDGHVEWTMSFDTPNGTKVSIVFKATLDGDKMSGTAAMGDISTLPFTAVKKK